MYRGRCVPLDVAKEKLVQVGNCLIFPDSTAKRFWANQRIHYQVYVVNRKSKMAAKSNQVEKGKVGSSVPQGDTVSTSGEHHLQTRYGHAHSFLWLASLGGQIGKKSLICLVGKSIVPRRGYAFLFRSPQQLPHLCLLRSCLQRDTRTLFRCAAIGTEDPGHCHEQKAQTLCVCPMTKVGGREVPP